MPTHEYPDTPRVAVGEKGLQLAPACLEARRFAGILPVVNLHTTELDFDQIDQEIGIDLGSVRVAVANRVAQGLVIVTAQQTDHHLVESQLG